MQQNERKAEEAKMGEEMRGERAGGEGWAQRRWQSTGGEWEKEMGIISKGPLYPGTRTEEPVCTPVCMFYFCTCCSERDAVLRPLIST